MRRKRANIPHGLKPRTARLSRLMFEAYTRDGLTMREIGQAVGYSVEYTRYLIHRYLRNALREHGIEWRPSIFTEIRGHRA